MKHRADAEWQCLAMSVPRMRACLCSGVHRPSTPKDWCYVSKTDGFTRNPRRAVIFPFDKEWASIAREAALVTKAKFHRGRWTDFVARILVIGDLEHPSDVIPCWQLEGDEPQDQQYFFE
jgi:hypothetical protein